MSTFFQLYQDVARDSGTIPRWASLSTVNGATGREARVKQWVIDAWFDIQKQRTDWLWMMDEFTGLLTSGTQRYSAASFSIDSRFSEWVFRDRQHMPALSAWLTSAGQAGEYDLEYLPWMEFRRRCLRGSAASRTGRPQLASQDDARQLVFYPTPDAAYTISGLYKKSPQTLADDDDVPECPAQFHSAIKWRALLYLGVYDEAPQQMGFWDQQLRRTLGELIQHQTPPIERPGALA